MTDTQIVTLVGSVSFLLLGCYVFFVREQVMSALFLAVISATLALLFDGLRQVQG